MMRASNITLFALKNAFLCVKLKVVKILNNR